MGKYSRRRFKIPNRVRITSEVTYEVVYIGTFSDPETLGECRGEEHQIVLKNSQSRTSMIQTFVHEVLHAIEEEYGILLSHKSIHELEAPIVAILKLNGWIPGIRQPS